MSATFYILTASPFEVDLNDKENLYDFLDEHVIYEYADEHTYERFFLDELKQYDQVVLSYELLMKASDESQISLYDVKFLLDVLQMYLGETIYIYGW